MANENHVVTGKVRLSYVNLITPQVSTDNNGQQVQKYNCTVLLPKSDTATKAKIDAAVEAAKQKGLQSKWSGVMPPRIDVPVRDGDGERPSDGMPYGEECKGCWVINVSANRKPRIVDNALQDIIDPAEIYSGMYARVSVDFFPYFSQNKKGIGVSLCNVQKLADGEPLGGAPATPDEDFGALDDLGI